MINRQYYSFIFLGLICLLLSLMFCPLVKTTYMDTIIFRYAGMAIMKGQVPYRDFFDHKPPLIFFVNFAGVLIGSWGLWIIDLCMALLATLVFFDLCRKYRLPFPWLLPLLFNLMIRDFLICRGLGMTREFTCYLQILFFCVLLGKSQYRYFLLGLLSALTFFMQQDQVLPLVPFGVYALLSNDPMPVPNRLIRLVSGFMTILLLLLLYFAWNHALGYFWDDAFRFNFTMYTSEKKSFFDHFRTTKRVLDGTNYQFPFMISITLGVTSLFLQNRKKGLVIAALMAVFLSLAPEFMGGRPLHEDFVYYFVSVSASVTLLLFTVFAFTEDQILADRSAQLSYGFLLCCSLCYTNLQHATHLTPADEPDNLLNARIMDYLRQHKPDDYQLYSFGGNGYIYAYNEFKILSPTRFIYQHFWEWLDRWDPDGHLLQTVEQDLIRHRTTYIIVDWLPVGRFRNTADITLWTSFLRDHYQRVPIPDTGTVELWKIKDPG